MRFTVEEINNSSGPHSILPGLKLGYQMYDSCTVSATLLSALDVLNYWRPSTSGPYTNYNGSQRPVAVVGPDSSSKTFTPATLLGSYLIPQVSVKLPTIHLSTKKVTLAHQILFSTSWKKKIFWSIWIASYQLMCVLNIFRLDVQLMIHLTRMFKEAFFHKNLVKNLKMSVIWNFFNMC